MPMLSDHERSRSIANVAAKLIVDFSIGDGLSWSAMMVILETVVTVVVCYVARTEGGVQQERFAAEIMDSLTEAAQLRVIDALRGMSKGT